MLSYFMSYDTIKTMNVTPAYGSTMFIDYESVGLYRLKGLVNHEEYKKLRNGQIQNLTGLINAWKNTPIRERAKVMICSLVCFAAAVTLAIIAYHTFAVGFAIPDISGFKMLAVSLLVSLSIMAHFVLTAAGCVFASWAVCSTKRNIAYLEQKKKELEDEADVEVRIAALKHVAEERLQQLSEERAACEAAIARRRSSVAIQQALFPLVWNCFYEFTRIQAALSRLGIAIPDAYTQQPVTGIV